MTALGRLPRRRRGNPRRARLSRGFRLSSPDENASVNTRPYGVASICDAPTTPHLNDGSGRFGAVFAARNGSRCGLVRARFRAVDAQPGEPIVELLGARALLF